MSVPNVRFHNIITVLSFLICEKDILDSFILPDGVCSVSSKSADGRLQEVPFRFHIGYVDFRFWYKTEFNGDRGQGLQS